ncbi:hypothetical protein [Mycolicibacterium mengxianglii]|uniref:hypothetical protein n=1 Tax=Mycolicibacterium mengxianglii TaxID=2736649 RepID=UPI0018D1914D
MTEIPGTLVPTCSWAERECRWNLARAFMDREGVDALLVYGECEDSGPAAFYFDTWFTNDRLGSIIVCSRTAEPIVHLPSPHSSTTTWPPRARTRLDS